jgi:hypothetical protein
MAKGVSMNLRDRGGWVALVVAGVLGLVAVPGRTVAQQAPLSLQQVVVQFYPHFLANGPLEATYPSPKKACYVVYDRLPNGSPRIVIAGYTDGTFGVLRALQRWQDGYRMISELTLDNYDFGTDGCDLSLVNLGGRYFRVVRIRFHGSNTGLTTDWYFQWHYTHFINLTPTRSGTDPTMAPSTQLVSSGAADLDGSGILSIVGIDEVATNGADTNGIPSTGSDRIYSLSNGAYAFDHSVALSRGFVVGGLSSKAYVRFRDDPAQQAPLVKVFMLRVINGPNYGTLNAENGQIDLMYPAPDAGNGAQEEEDQGCGAGDRKHHGKDQDQCAPNERVTSAQILINGTEVVTQGQINSGVDRLETRVQLGQDNTISVNLEGKQGAGILLILDPVFREGVQQGKK